MNSRPITISFVVVADGHVVSRDIAIEWIECDDAETIATDIKEAILNIE